MPITGHCLCGALEYEITGEPIFKGLCHCRSCQHSTGGMATIAIAFPEDSVTFTKGTPKTWKNPDLENGATRYFCGDCGSPMMSRTPAAPGMAIVRVGNLDDPSLFDKADTAIWMSEAQPFHLVPEGTALFDEFPPHE